MEELNEYKEILGLVARLNQEAPEIAKLYTAAGKMSKQVEEKQEKLDKVTTKQLKKAEELVKKADAGLQQINEVLKTVQEIEARVEKISKTELSKPETSEEAEKRMNCLVEIIGTLAMQQAKTDRFSTEDFIGNHTIVDLYRRHHQRLKGPVLVWTKGWSQEYCFAVDRISSDGKRAVGLWFAAGKPTAYKRNQCCWEPLIYDSYQIFAGSTYNKVMATFPYWKDFYKKELQAADPTPLTGFMNIPEGIDEELPFN